MRDRVLHLEIQIVAVKVQNPSKCLLKLYECSLCPDQNKTWWQVPVYDIPLFISESPQFPPTEREKTERRGGAQGTWSVFRRKMAVSSCQSWAFWCHRLGTGLSVSQCNSYQRLTHSRDRRWGGNTRKSTHSLIYTWHINFVKSGSVNYDGAKHSHLALKQKKKEKIEVIWQSRLCIAYDYW